MCGIYIFLDTFQGQLIVVRIIQLDVYVCGQAALVEIMHHCGAVISGSDVSERFYTDEILENLGIKAKNFDENNINDDIDFVIYSSAYKTDKNPDLIAAIRKNVPCILYTQALGQYSSLFYSCGV